ncbi:MAG: response regulator, partial [Acidobacteria bacterium]|nr:response regulator [Acidobacteriota bacterium]
QIANLKDETRRVIVRKKKLSSQGRELFPKAELIGIDDRTEGLVALCSGGAEFLMIEARPLQWHLLQPPRECLQVNLNVLSLDLPPNELGIGSSLEASVVANVLRDEIDAMVADGSYKVALKDWAYFSIGYLDLIYRENSAQRATRVSYTLVVVLLLLLIALCRFVVLTRRSQQAALAADEAKTQFLANMSHEIRTPLNGILGLSEILLRSPLDDEQNKLLKMLRSSGKNLLSIVNDVLDLARVAREQILLQPEVMNLNELIEDSLRPFAVTAREKHLTFGDTGLEQIPDSVLADPVRLRQIIVNLVANAIKFTDEGSVRVCLGYDGSQFLLSVADTGIGISDAGKEHLFEKFFQADSSISRRFGGTGLGLSIVHELIASMGGTIEVESILGKGSTFKVAIPIQTVQVAPKAAEEIPVEPRQSSTANILVVEDNMVNQLVVQSLLEMMGYHVALASDGVEGVAAWKNSHFDAILMDSHMPNMDGALATSEIRKQESSARRIPIIALTASAMESEKERCFAAGMDDFLSKPIQAEELNRVLSHWLSLNSVSNS